MTDPATTALASDPDDARAAVAARAAHEARDRATWARAALVVVLAWHSHVWVGDPARGPQPGQWLLHAVELGIHETGHLLFQPFGETLYVLGGSLFQLVVPMAFVASFWRRDRFAAAVCGWWLAVGFWDVAIYVADARAQQLDLVGGGEHDWAMLLDHWNRLPDDLRFGRALGHLGSALAIVSLAAALLLAPRSRDPGKGEAPPP
ncbi:MAG: hypothetical protein JO180_09075 [Gemmatirosa sp.]|nr:hypothetical protein [Gemmatirosa sp.]